MSEVKKGRVPRKCPLGFPGRYTVKEGDTMYFLAERFNLPLEEFIKANPHIADPEEIYPGDVLCAPKNGRKPEECPPGFPGRYTVKPGDTMFLVAREFSITLDELIKANPHISDPAKIFPGDVLCVPREYY